MRATLRATLRNELAELPPVAAALREFLASHGVGGRAAYVTELALEEVVSNVIRHGYAAPVADEILVVLELAPDGIELTVVDHACTFDPSVAPASPPDVPFAERRVGGLGLPLLHRLTQGLRHERIGDANHLRVRIEPRC